MLSCKESARLISDGLDRGLSPWVRLSLRLHLMMCSACRVYRQQIQTLNKLIFERSAGGWLIPTLEAQSLSDDARRRIKAALR